MPKVYLIKLLIVFLCFTSFLFVLYGFSRKEILYKNPIPQGIVEIKVIEEDEALNFTLMINEHYDQGISKENYYTDYIIEIENTLLGYKEKKTFNVLDDKGIHLRIDKNKNYKEVVKGTNSILFLCSFYAKEHPKELLFVIELEVVVYE